MAGLSGYGAANGRLNPVIKTRKGERRNNKEMNKKILASIFVIGILAFAMGWGTYSYFSDTETSSGNVFQAGTIDLAVNNENPWTSKIFTFTDVKPSQNLTSFTINITNVGNNPGNLSFTISYVEKDKEVPANFEFPANMTADGFASLVYIKAAQYQYHEPGYTGSWQNDLPDMVLKMDDNADGKVSIYEYKKHCPVLFDDTPPYDPFVAGAWIAYKITLHLGDSLSPWEVGGDILTGVEDNRPQADGIEITFSATLVQLP
jgi:predicted ribosomally synthesized peptide with SipW-like signal peptide